MRSRAGAMVALFAVVSLVWLGSPGQATADTITVGGTVYTITTLIHSSTEDFFAAGEKILCSGAGCPGFSEFGNTTGTPIWEVKELVFTALSPAGAPVTIYDYTVTNDQSPSIWSLHISTNVIPVGGVNCATQGGCNAPTNWVFTSGTEWVWSNTVAGFGIDPGGHSATNTIDAVVAGTDGVQFSPGFLDITSAHTNQFCGTNDIAIRLRQPTNGCNWIISAPEVVPEPSTMLLLGAGMVGMGFVRRRAARRRALKS